MTNPTPITKNLRSETITLEQPDHKITAKAVFEKMQPESDGGLLGQILPSGLEPEPYYRLKQIDIEIRGTATGLIQELMLNEDQLNMLQTALERVVPYSSSSAMHFDLPGMFGMRKKR